MASKKYVGYCRVSTKEQGISKLSLDHQESVITEYVEKVNGELLLLESESISGRAKYRPGLTRALNLIESSNATLIVSDIDRLGRDAKELFTIKDTVPDIVFVARPDMGLMEFGVMATFAQVEHEKISNRVKVALQKRYEKTGKKNGNPKGIFSRKAIEMAAKLKTQKAKDNPLRKIAANLVKQYLAEGLSLSKIAKKLNDLELKTPTGKDYQASSVQALIKLFDLQCPRKRSN